MGALLPYTTKGNLPLPSLVGYSVTGCALVGPHQTISQFDITSYLHIQKQAKCVHTTTKPEYIMIY